MWDKRACTNSHLIVIEWSDPDRYLHPSIALKLPLKKTLKWYRSKALNFEALLRSGSNISTRSSLSLFLKLPELSRTLDGRKRSETLAKSHSRLKIKGTTLYFYNKNYYFGALKTFKLASIIFAHLIMY